MGICQTVNAKANRDGSAVLRVRANSFEWIARWVVQYGMHARIVSPYNVKALILNMVTN